MVNPATPATTGRHDQPGPLLRTVVGDVLRRTRREQRRTLADVADAANVSMPYLSELERGRKEASSEILSAICAALGIDLAGLLAEVGTDLLVERARRCPRARRTPRPGGAAARRQRRHLPAGCLSVRRWPGRAARPTSWPCGRRSPCRRARMPRP